MFEFRTTKGLFLSIFLSMFEFRSIKGLCLVTWIPDYQRLFITNDYCTKQNFFPTYEFRTTNGLSLFFIYFLYSGLSICSSVWIPDYQRTSFNFFINVWIPDYQRTFFRFVALFEFRTTKELVSIFYLCLNSGLPKDLFHFLMYVWIPDYQGTCSFNFFINVWIPIYQRTLSCYLNSGLPTTIALNRILNFEKLWIFS
mgnify:CR=1 FL=1